MLKLILTEVATALALAAFLGVLLLWVRILAS